MKNCEYETRKYRRRKKIINPVNSESFNVDAEKKKNYITARIFNQLRLNEIFIFFS